MEIWFYSDRNMNILFSLTGLNVLADFKRFADFNVLEDFDVTADYNVLAHFNGLAFI